MTWWLKLLEGMAGEGSSVSQGAKMVGDIGSFSNDSSGGKVSTLMNMAQGSEAADPRAGTQPAQASPAELLQMGGQRAPTYEPDLGDKVMAGGRALLAKNPFAYGEFLGRATDRGNREMFQDRLAQMLGQVEERGTGMTPQERRELRLARELYTGRYTAPVDPNTGYRQRDVPQGDGQLQRQATNPQTGAWENLGETFSRFAPQRGGPRSSLTASQEADWITRQRIREETEGLQVEELNAMRYINPTRYKQIERAHELTAGDTITEQRQKDALARRAKFRNRLKQVKADTEKATKVEKTPEPSLWDRASEYFGN